LKILFSFGIFKVQLGPYLLGYCLEKGVFLLPLVIPKRQFMCKLFECIIDGCILDFFLHHSPYIEKAGIAYEKVKGIEAEDSKAQYEED
jgi:hypothetical protein